MPQRRSSGSFSVRNLNLGQFTNRRTASRRPDPLPPHLQDEIGRLIELMPASGRMVCKIVSRADQPVVIDADLPRPWAPDRDITINFDLWGRLSRPQRDLLLLRTVCWSTETRWFKLDWYRVTVAAGLVGTIVEGVQADAVGLLVAGGLTALAGLQIWRSQHGPQVELSADETALQVAQRRGYDEPEAAGHLMTAIEAVAELEGRPGLDVTELLRVQNLKAIAGLSPVGVPERMRVE
ncbi:MAG: DUF3318 domain-containing protein [Synechococcales bacterium]|nr:DUF3318 domain-containing protein [Synechococcales bacterium]